jgi:hypothetical protein
MRRGTDWSQVCSCLQGAAETGSHWPATPWTLVPRYPYQISLGAAAAAVAKKNKEGTQLGRTPEPCPREESMRREGPGPKPSHSEAAPTSEILTKPCIWGSENRADVLKYS